MRVVTTTLMLLALCLLPGAAAPQFAGPKVTFCAVGDVMLDRGVRAAIERHGSEYPLEKLSRFLDAHDLAFCNLECVISDRGSRVRKVFAFRGDTTYVQALRKSGINIFSLANNHSIDYGREALLDTKDILERNGLHAIGAGASQAEASEARIIEAKGIKFALLAFVSFFDNAVVHSEELPGPAWADSARVASEIRRACEFADFVIVSFHWGPESTARVSESQVTLAHLAVNNGADLVLGHHPHVIQGVERYGDGYIIYSLGNFVFDSSDPDSRDSMIFECTFSEDGVISPRLLPAVIRNCQPDFARGEDYERIKTEIIRRSGKYRVNLAEEGGTLYIR